MSAPLSAPRVLHWVAWLATLLLTVACGTIRLVSPYDEVIDRGVTDFHSDISAFVLKMEASAGTPEGAYDANKNKYAELRASVMTLRVRAAATPKSDITLQSLDEVLKNIDNLAKLHAIGGANGLRKAVADPALGAISVQCEAILKLEIAKKRGDAD